MVLAALLFITRVADTTTVAPVTAEYLSEGHAHSLQDKEIPPYVKIYRIHGPFLFGSASKLLVIADHVATLPETVILRLRNMTALDGTGLHAMETLAHTLEVAGKHLILCGARKQPASLIARADFHRHVGDANICRNVQEALQRAVEIHQESRS